MDYLLALDQGTTSSRAAVFDARGRLVAIAAQPFEQIYPQPGWVEHCPHEIWRSQRHCIAQVLNRARLTIQDIRGIGITNQRETTLVWNRITGQPIHNAIVWQDRRTAGVCQALSRQGLASTIRQETGLELDAYFSATKLQWLLHRTPGARAAAEAGELCFGTVDSWLIWQLTGGAAHLTDVSNASRTMLLNLRTLDWSSTLLDRLEIPRRMLPEIVPSSAVVAHTCPDVLGAAIPIAGIAGDQQAATFGQTCFSPGMAKNTYGTGCFLLMNTGEVPVASHQRLLSTVGWQRGSRDAPATYTLEGSIFIAGALVQWLRDGLGLFRESAEVEDLAAQVGSSDGVMIVPALTGLGAPHWDAQARGTILGITRGTTKSHIARAALEAIALQVVDLVSAMQRDGVAPLKELRVDGGAAANDILMQLQADLLNVPVVRPTVTETTALGAAYLAGLATGVYADEAELQGFWRMDKTFEPTLPADARAEMLGKWQQAVERAKGWA